MVQPTDNHQLGTRYNVHLDVVRVPVPPERLKSWKIGVGMLYKQLEELIEQDAAQAATLGGQA